MQLSVVRITLASLLFSSVWAAAANNDSTPGGRLKTLLKPPINSQTGIWGEERRESVLRGLLQVRQSFCPAGYGKCTSSSRKCCPLNGGCCPNDVCCGHGEACCGVGCCNPGYYCFTDRSTGRLGCCPNGETCSGIENECENPSFLPCRNDDFCCSPDSTCFRDNAGNPRCRASGSNPAPTTRRTTTFRTTSTTVRTTSTKLQLTTRTSSTQEIVSTARTSTNEPVFTTSTTDLIPTVYPTPTPSSGAQNVIIYPTDTRIIWVGTSWILGPSSCNSTAQSKKISGIGTFSLVVNSGASVYLTLSAHNVKYEISVNGRSTTYSVTTTSNDCKLTWSSGVVVNTTSIIVTVQGPAIFSTPFDGRRQLSGDSSFEFHNFLMTTPQSVTTSSLTNPSGLPSSGNPVIFHKVHSALTLYTSLATAFIIFFCLF